MATSLEEPGRSRAIHLINQALNSRNLTPPKSNLPLTIPFLAHTDFQADTHRWLASLLNQHKQFAIPLHLPTCRLREAAHSTLRSRLHNHRKWEDHFHHPPHADQLPCGCSHLRQLLSPAYTPPTDEHLIVTLEDLQLPGHMRRFLNASMTSTFFPTKRRYWETFRHNLKKWLKHHGPTAYQHHWSNTPTLSHHPMDQTLTSPATRRPLHRQIPQTITRISWRYSGPPPCRSRTTTPPYFLPSNLLSRMLGHVAITGAFPTTSRRYRPNHSPDHPADLPCQPAQKVQVGPSSTTSTCLLELSI